MRVREGSSQRSGAPSDVGGLVIRVCASSSGQRGPATRSPSGSGPRAAGRSAAASRAQGRKSGRIQHLPPGPPGPSDALWSGPTPLHAAPPPLPSGPQQLPRRRKQRHPGSGRRDLKAAAATAAEASALPVPRAPPSDGGRLAAGRRRTTVATVRDRAPQRHSAAGGGAPIRLPDRKGKQKDDNRDLMRSPKRNHQTFTAPHSHHITIAFSK